jgi:hypothetical protein
VKRNIEITAGPASAPKLLSLDFEAEQIPLAAGKTKPSGAPSGAQP